MALCLALPPLLLPLYNPDLFWHLSAGRWMAENARVPRQDFLSFSLAGTPWLDFEWLSQLTYYSIYSRLGIAGLWGLKIVLLAACGSAILRTVRLYGIPSWAEAASLVLWSSGVVTVADIRPDLFSMLCFSILLYQLEALRLGKVKREPSRLVGVFALFVLWSNLHAGFAFGLMLVGFYWAGSFRDGGKPRFLVWLGLAALAGTLCNPYGPGPYRVMLDHWLHRADLTLIIQEWQPISFQNRYHWPFWPELALCLVLLLTRARKKDLPLGSTAVVLFLAYGAVGHARLASSFNAAAVPFIALLARDSGWLKARRVRAWLAVSGLAYAIFLGGVFRKLPVAGLFTDLYIPRGAAEFISEERPVMEGLRVYNVWEWGGYLGFRLHPWYKVFEDGRYIFHSRLKETEVAALGARECQAMLDKYGLDAALVRNVGARFPTTRVYPDGRSKGFLRPWYLEFFPRGRWALVYWDERALFFVDRARVPAAWLKEHEYRYVRPGDDEAFADAMSRKEIPPGPLALERNRHRIDGAIYLSRRGF